MSKTQSQSKEASKSWEAETRRSEERADACLVTMRGLRDLAEKEASLVQSGLRDMEESLVDPAYILTLTKSIHGTGSQNTADYVKRNTEILLNEHASMVREKVIAKMRQQIADMADEMRHDAKRLGDDVANFFDFIQCTYRSASDSFGRVVELAKKNYEKVESIKEFQDRVFSTENELQLLEQQLLESLMCYAFLATLSSSDEEEEKCFLSKEFLRSFGPAYSYEDTPTMQKEVLEMVLAGVVETPPVPLDVSPDAVLRMMSRLKDSNLALLSNIHLSKNSSHFGAKELAASQKEMADELEAWDAKITSAEEELSNTQNINRKLKKEISDMNMEGGETDKAQREIELKKLSDLYELCTGSDAKSVDLTLMKNAIDTCLDDLLSEINLQPRRKIKDLIKTLEAEKKQSERKTEEKLRAQRAQERLKKAGAI